MKVLVTGAAGFIGMHVSQRLLARGDEVVGLDNLNDYYDPQLKHDRLARLTPHAGFRFVKLDVADRAGMATLFAAEKFDRVVHLAAQAGVRYSLENPHAYIDSNIVGFTNILEGCRHNGVQHLVYASSSSVYGGNTADAVLRARQRRPPGQPVRRHQEGQRADGAHLQPPVRPADHRAALLHGLRPLGPAGHGAVPVHQGDPRRPSRSTSSTTARWCATSPTSTTSSRAWCACSTASATPDAGFDAAAPDPARSNAPYRVFNIGNNDPVPLMDFIEAHRRGARHEGARRTCCRCRTATCPPPRADVSELEAWTGFRPATPVRDGIGRFVQWYRDYFKV